MDKIKLDASFWEEIVKQSLAKGGDNWRKRITTLETFYQRELESFSPVQTFQLPFFGRKRIHLTCTNKPIYWSPSFIDPIRSICFLQFILNLCGQKVYFHKNKDNEKWWYFLQNAPQFKLRVNFQDSPLKWEENGLFLIRQEELESISPVALKNIYLESNLPIVIGDKTIFSSEVQLLKEMISPKVSVLEELPPERNVIYFTFSQDLPDVAYIYQNLLPSELFRDKVELLPPLYEGFSPYLLFNQVIVYEKRYSLEECKRAFLDYMPGKRDFFRYKFFHKQLSEKEVEQVFIKKLKDK